MAVCWACSNVARSNDRVNPFPSNQSAHTFLRGSGDTVLVTNVQRRFVKLVNGEIVATAQQPDVLRSLSSFAARSRTRAAGFISMCEPST
jgi:hypothetical protein